MTRLARPVMGLMFALALQAGATLPTVVTEPPLFVTGTLAILRGQITDIGEAAPEVTFFLGEADGGTTPANWDTFATLPDTQTGSFVTAFPELSPATTYHVRVRAVNTAGEVWTSPSMTFQTLLVPPDIVNLPASNVAALSATIGSEVTGNGGESATGTIYYGLFDGGTDSATWTASIDLGVQFGVATTPLTGLTQGTQYFYRAYAENSSGGTWAEETATFTTTPLLAPTIANRPANGITGSSAVLRGEVLDNGNDDPAITMYYGTTDGGTDSEGWDRVAELGLDGGKFSVFVGGLDPMTTYYFRSFGSNLAGSDWAPETASFSTSDASLPPVVINEIHYDEDNKLTRSEFVELLNTTSEMIFLDGWRLSSAVDFDFPAGASIAPGGFLVVSEDPVTVNSKWGVASIGPWEGKLNNEGETVRLRDETDVVIDEVDYKIGFPWPTVGAPPSYSIELVNPGLENDLGGSWRASIGGSGDGSGTLVAGGSTWKFFEGTAEPSAAPGDWRQIEFDDSGWAAGDGSIGYGEGFVNTNLENMQGNFTTVYFRKTFTVDDPLAIGSLLLRAQANDGFNAWINGTHIADLNVPGPELPFSSVAVVAGNNTDYVDHPIPNGGGLLVPGENVLAVQVLNSSLNDAEAYFDAILQTNVAAAQGPTPGFPNSVFATNNPPQIRHVNHTPVQPAAGEEVTISAEITDPDGVGSATLHYRIVRPGSYVRLIDGAYESGWIDVPMNDDGTEGDQFSGDNTWSALVPAAVQQHRNLIRYRITIGDAMGNSVRVPYADDLQPNFAYYCYSGVPAWRGALSTGQPRLSYTNETLTKVPVYHMIAREPDVLGCMYNDSLGVAKTYRYYATVVYDGEVYDHIKFRIKGQASTRQTGKNKIKWNFNRGHRFEARDNYGKKYLRKWDKFALQTGTCPWWGSNQSTGGMILNEQASYKFYRMLGVPSCNTHLFHLRIVDRPQEATTSQYEGDFWGLYIALEEPDGRFLDEMGLPDGNLYKMNGSPNKRNQGPRQTSGTSDVTNFISQRNGSLSYTFWRRLVNLPRYYDYKIGTTLINNTDLRAEWNCLYYARPVIPGDPDSRKWEMYPWDLDLTWESKPHIRAESRWENWQAVLNHSTAERDFENRAREVWDLMCSSGEGAKVVEELRRFLDGDGRTRIVEANQALWDYHPRKSKKGIWYKNNPRLPAANQNWEGLVDYMKNFVSPGGYGADRLLSQKVATPVAVPAKPIITAIGDPVFPTSDLRFQSSDFSATGTSFRAMQWRLAEITDPDSPNFDPTAAWVYEIDPVWDSGELTSFQNEITIPPIAARVGHTYRARVRHRGTSTQWSHWSDPVEFVAGTPDVSLFQENLVVSEVMYDPSAATAAEILAGYESGDFEYIEIKNIGTLALDLSDVRFTKGIDFDFVTGAITTLGPGNFALVVRNQDAFESRYGAGLPVAGAYTPDNLSNGGENVKLSFGAGVAIQEFHYLPDSGWPEGLDGTGLSMVLIDPDSAPDHTLGGNWMASASVGGSPGADDSGSSLEHWKMDHFTPAELLDEAISGDLVDLENDGLNTVLEYGLVGDPKVADPGKLPVVVTVADGGDEDLALQFRRRVVAGDLTYEIESSSGLADWDPVVGAVLMSSDDNGDGSATETWRLPDAIAMAPEVFLRLRVTVN